MTELLLTGGVNFENFELFAELEAHPLHIREKIKTREIFITINLNLQLNFIFYRPFF